MNAFKFPLTAIALFFVCGIWLAHLLTPSLTAVTVAVSVTVPVLAIYFLLYIRGLKRQTLSFILCAAASLFIGCIAYLSGRPEHQHSHYLKFAAVTEAPSDITLQIRERLKSSKFNERYTASVLSVDRHATVGKVMLNIAKDSLDDEYLPGSIIYAHAVFKPHRKPLNPSQFDYGHYLDKKGIPAQIYSSRNGIIETVRVTKTLPYYAAALRSRIITNLKAAGFNKEELQVVIALILGQQQEISKEILHDYQYAGAVHILSVSGLHVGFILLFVNFLLARLPQTGIFRILRLSVVVLSLWGFALIAGLSPSVVRSVTMFSFVAIGMYMKRETNIFHTLTVSLLLILLAEPAFLFDIGFQLSYVSLFFILWLQPLLSAIYRPTTRFGKYFMDIITVSFAAQIGAMPLSILYFHQFPGLFFITNMIILPFTALIMAVGVIVMILAALNYIPALPIAALELMIKTLNAIIKKIASFEQFIIRDIPLNTSMMISFYVMIVLIIYYFKHRTYRKCITAMLSILAFQFICFFSDFGNNAITAVTVFHSRDKSLLVEKWGDSIVAHHAGTKPMAFHKTLMQSYMTEKFCSSVRYEPMRNFVSARGHDVLVIDSSGTFIGCKADVILLTGSARVNLERLLWNAGRQ